MPIRNSSTTHNSVAKASTLLAVLMMTLVCGSLVLPSSAIAASNSKQAAKEALSKNRGGEVLGVSTETDNNGRRVFAVKIINNGRVRVVRIPQS